MAFFRDQLFNILQIKIEQRQNNFSNNADLKKKVEKKPAVIGTIYQNFNNRDFFVTLQVISTAKSRFSNQCLGHCLFISFNSFNRVKPTP